MSTSTPTVLCAACIRALSYPIPDQDQPIWIEHHSTIRGYLAAISTPEPCYLCISMTGTCEEAREVLSFMADGEQTHDSITNTSSRSQAWTGSRLCIARNRGDQPLDQRYWIGVRVCNFESVMTQRLGNNRLDEIGFTLTPTWRLFYRVPYILAPPFIDPEERRLSVLKYWLNRCERLHVSCNPTRELSTAFPERLIDIGRETPAVGDAAVIRLINGNIIASDQRYATLSHGWDANNTTRFPCLLSTNLESFQRGIHFSELSKGFQDAVTIARCLELRYLWIDLVCIVQDDEEELQQASEHVEEVYRGAFLNMSADWGSEEQGFLCDPNIPGFLSHTEGGYVEDISLHVSLHLERNTPEGYEQETAAFKFQMGPRQFDQQWHADVSFSPLKRRNRALHRDRTVPRTLHFCRDQVFWECDNFFASEQCISGPNSVDEAPVDWLPERSSHIAMIEEDPNIHEIGYSDDHPIEWPMNEPTGEMGIGNTGSPFPVPTSSTLAHRVETNSCQRCSEVDWAKIFLTPRSYTDLWVQHHESYGQLLTAAHGGCELCGLLLNYVQPLRDRVLAAEARALRDGTAESVNSGFTAAEQIRSSDGWDRFYALRYELSGTSIGQLLVTPLSPTLWRCGTRKALQGEYDFDLWRSWIEDCCKHDAACSPLHLSKLPTRVIDVGKEGEDPKLVESRDVLGRYLTLSHCWGKERILTTTEENYEQHLQRIPFQLLPATFQQSIEVTRGLGYKYLWIDSLCIKQGDKKDWENECIKMADVYTNSDLTIAARGAKDGTQGLQIGSRHRPINIAVVDIHLADMNGTASETASSPGPLNSRSSMVQVEFGQIPREPYTIWRTFSPLNHSRTPLVSDPFIVSTNPLDTRAWVMQERLLSQRFLSFTPEKVFMECKSCVRTDIWQHKLPLKTYGYGDGNMLASEDRETLRSKWYDIVESYTSLNLTHGSDSMPAISAVACHLQSKMGGEYLAGLWENDLAFGLSWIAKLSDTRSENPATSSGPSWSWAACDRPVKYHFKRKSRTIDLLDGHETAWHFEDRDTWLVAPKVLKTKVQPQGGNEYAMIQSGELLVSGKLQRAILDPNGFDPDSGCTTLLTSCGAAITTVQLDNPEGSLQGPIVYCLFLAYLPRQRCAAIVLEKVDTAYNTFRRLGIAGMEHDDQCGYIYPQNDAPLSERLLELRKSHHLDEKEHQVFCSERQLEWLLKGSYEDITLV